MDNEKDPSKNQGFFRSIFGRHPIMQKTPEEVDKEFGDIFEESRNNPIFPDEED